MEKLTNGEFICEYFNSYIDGCIVRGQIQKCRECILKQRYDRLAELEKLLELGHLVEKVFKVGDVVYSPSLCNGKFSVTKDTIKEVVEVDGEIKYLLENEQSMVSLSRIFATEEQAQIRVKEFDKNAKKITLY